MSRLLLHSPSPGDTSAFFLPQFSSPDGEPWWNPPSTPGSQTGRRSLTPGPVLVCSFNGGSRIFSLSRPPLFSSLLASFVSSHLKRLSLHGSSNWKIMDLINWSLSAIDTIFSRRSLGSGEPVCPDGTSRPDIRGMHGRGGKSCVWRLFLWRTRGYLFGSMITGILLIGLGFDLGYRKIRKTGTAVQSLTWLPIWMCGNSGDIHFEGGGRQPSLQPILQERKHGCNRASMGVLPAGRTPIDEQVPLQPVSLSCRQGPGRSDSVYYRWR